MWCRTRPKTEELRSDDVVWEGRGEGSGRMTFVAGLLCRRARSTQTPVGHGHLTRGATSKRGCPTVGDRGDVSQNGEEAPDTVEGREGQQDRGVGKTLDPLDQSSVRDVKVSPPSRTGNRLSKEQDGRSTETRGLGPVGTEE